MALKVLGGIASDIAESAYYSFMADESTDASNIEQLVICMCWVGEEMTVCEEYIGLMPVTRTNANTIAVCIPDVLMCMNHRIQDACGVLWWMFDHYWNQNVIAAEIKKLNEKRLLMHCSCHSLNLAVGDTIKNIPLLKDTLDMAYDITNLIKNSTENKQNFWDKWNVRDIDSPTLKILCPTRWTVRTASLSDF